MQSSASGRFDFLPTSIDSLHLLQRKVLGDKRGYFQRMFCAEDLAELGWREPIAQINHTYTSLKGSIRGMHLQLFPNAEMKLITCMKGEVWDVAVDLRAESATFLKWHAVLLSQANQRSFLIPAGFAHGFQTISDEVEMLYCHSKPYAPASEMGLNPFDVQLAIEWPLGLTGISDKDRNWPMLSKEFQGVIV
ncbi:MAG: dTDP-4-dehydrorhamnose 3,5-epimerase family protein [Burkholderiales bacterium]|nr:dTDP-4-dehydrorhamnose 3,5-epimerase family protein [Burkholderiales bacterium]